MINKPNFCKACPLNHLTSQGQGEGYVPFTIKPGYIILVGEAAGEEEAQCGKGFSGGAGQWLRSLCKAAKIEFENCSLGNVIGCRPPHNIFPGDQKWEFTSKEVAKAGVEYCREYHFLPQLEKANKQKIVALGNHALEALTTRSGISIWRGSPLPLKGDNSKVRVLPTLHPAYLMRNAKLSSVVIGDLRKSLQLPPENYNLFPTLEELESWNAKEFAFDFEWDRFGNITLCGLSDRFYSAIVVPFTGAYVNELKKKFENAIGLIGHNIINADMSHFQKLGWRLRDDVKIHDTMLKQHLVQPDYPHDLGFVASVFTNKVFWKGKGWEQEDEDGNIIPGGQQYKTWDNPITAIPIKLGGYGGCKSNDEAFRLYNARDTDGEYQINVPLSQKLKQYEMEDTYWNVSVPVAYICREIGEKGFKIDTSRLGEIRETIDKEIDVLENQLPDGLRPYFEEVSCNLEAPPGTYKRKVKLCKHGQRKSGGAAGSKGKHKNLPCVSNPPEQKTALETPGEVIFDSPGFRVCPICGKEISSGKMDFAKVIKGTRKERIVPYNSPVQVQEYVAQFNLKEVRDLKTGNITTGKRARKAWGGSHPEFMVLDQLKKQITLRNNFAKDTLLDEERMYFNLKVHGTAEGRLASSGRRDGIDLNIQNQPKAFRKIYIPDFPDWGILSLDIVQGENMLTAWIAKDWERWERLNTPGYDEHCDLASRIFGRTITKSEEDKLFRDVGKKKNHAKNYGMGVKKERDYLASEGYNFTEKEIKEQNEIWKQLNKRTAQWQQETIGQASKVGYLVNAFGRRRWFGSRDVGGQALAFLPASTLADMVLRMMIAHFPDRREMQEPLYSLKLERAFEMCKDWRMAAQVHDELVLMGPLESLKEQAVRSREIMIQPWKELEGFHFNVDIKWSAKSWGECKGLEL